jgi:hypothetical protein
MIAYNGANGTVVLFGGDVRRGDGGAGIYLNETWTWNGITRTQQFPVSGPSKRATASLTYDAGLGQVVLFGGSGNFE